MLRDQLKNDAMIAVKAKDLKKANALRYLVSLIDKKELTLPAGKMTDVDVVAVLQKEMKNKEESLSMFEKAQRLDLVAETKFEIDLLSTYLPKALTEAEVESMIDEAIAAKGNNFGAVMGIVVAEVAGRMGGTIISQLVKKKLGQ